MLVVLVATVVVEDRSALVRKLVSGTAVISPVTVYDAVSSLVFLVTLVSTVVMTVVDMFPVYADIVESGSTIRIKDFSSHGEC